jgi:uncharacterized membrane protein YbhN (UPF0104 family)
MTVTATTTPSSARSNRTFQTIFLAPKGDGTRRRSSTDAVKLVTSIAVFVILWVGVSSRTKLQVDIVSALHPPAWGLSWLITVLWWLTSIGTVVLVIGAAALSRRLEIFRDLGVSALLAVGSSWLIQNLFSAIARFPASDQAQVPGVKLGFPVPLLTAAVAVILASLPYLSRHLQRLLQCFIVIALISGLMKGVGLPIALIASVVLGWGVVSITHLIFGSPTGVPDAEAVEGLLRSLGIDAEDVKPVAHQEWGLARFNATTETGRWLRISFYGRDARDSQLLSKLYRTIVLRKDTGPFMLTRAQQVDHECYLGLLAGEAVSGGSATLLTSGLVGGAQEGMVVVEVPSPTSLSGLLDAADVERAAKAKAAEAEAQAEARHKAKAAAGKEGQEKAPPGTIPPPPPIPADVEPPVVSDAVLRSMASIIVGLQDAGLSHGAIDPQRIVVDGDRAVLLDFNRARTHAPDEALHQDVAAMIVVMAVAAGTDKAVAIGLQVLGEDRFVAALGFLQGPALPPLLNSALRRHKAKGILKELRAKGATAAAVEEPKPIELRRISWTNLILGIGTLIGGWALIGVFLHVAGAFSTIKNANWAWVAATAVLAPSVYLGSAVSSMGSIITALPLWPLCVLELSNTFSGLALGTPAVLAARIRFFQKQGIDTTIAVSSGVLVSTASWIVKGGLFLISLPFALGAMHFSDLKSGGSAGSHERLLELVVLVVVVVGVAIIAVLGVPRLRRMAAAKLLPRLREVVDHFKVLAQHPAKISEIFGGMLMAQLITAICLGTSLHAFGEQLPLPVIIVVLTLGSILGGVSPVPGGMGVVEAGMILGLRAAGVPSDQAVAAVFVQRLFTAYLPPLAGWFALIWLRRREYL